MGPSRRHIKQGHLNKWSLRHKYIRASIISVETPGYMSLFAELTTLTEGVHERCFSDLRQQSGNAQFSQRRKLPRSRGGSLNDAPKKQQQADTDAHVTDSIPKCT